MKNELKSHVGIHIYPSNVKNKIQIVYMPLNIGLSVCGTSLPFLKHGFHTWLASLGRLQTKEKLFKIGVLQPNLHDLWLAARNSQAPTKGRTYSNNCIEESLS